MASAVELRGAQDAHNAANVDAAVNSNVPAGVAAQDDSLQTTQTWGEFFTAIPSKVWGGVKSAASFAWGVVKAPFVWVRNFIFGRPETAVERQLREFDEMDNAQLAEWARSKANDGDITYAIYNLATLEDHPSRNTDRYFGTAIMNDAVNNRALVRAAFEQTLNEAAQDA